MSDLNVCLVILGGVSLVSLVVLMLAMCRVAGLSDEAQERALERQWRRDLDDLVIADMERQFKR